MNDPQEHGSGQHLHKPESVEIETGPIPTDFYTRIDQKGQIELVTAMAGAPNVVLGSFHSLSELKSWLASDSENNSTPLSPTSRGSQLLRLTEEQYRSRVDDLGDSREGLPKPLTAASVSSLRNPFSPHAKQPGAKLS